MERTGDSVVTNCRSEHHVVPPHILRGKKAENLLEALEKGMAIPLFDQAKMVELASKWSIIVQTFWPDGATNNFRSQRCLSCVAEHRLPRNVLVDATQDCFLHKLTPEEQDRQLRRTLRRRHHLLLDEGNPQW